MKASELREKSVEELNGVLLDQLKEQFKLRLQASNLGFEMLLRDLGNGESEVTTLSWWASMDAIRAFAPKGIILSGGPESVTEAGSPRAAGSCRACAHRCEPRRQGQDARRDCRSAAARAAPRPRGGRPARRGAASRAAPAPAPAAAADPFEVHEMPVHAEEDVFADPAAEPAPVAAELDAMLVSARAVMAMMGVFFAGSGKVVRISFVAASPSNTGICMSISTMS